MTDYMVVATHRDSDDERGFREPGETHMTDLEDRFWIDSVTAALETAAPGHSGNSNLSGWPSPEFRDLPEPNLDPGRRRMAPVRSKEPSRGSNKFYLLHLDAVEGGHQGWPVYLFGGAGLFCVAPWGYVAVKLAS